MREIDQEQLAAAQLQITARRQGGSVVEAQSGRLSSGVEIGACAWSSMVWHLVASVTQPVQSNRPGHPAGSVWLFVSLDR